MLTWNCYLQNKKCNISFYAFKVMSFDDLNSIFLLWKEINHL